MFFYLYSLSFSELTTCRRRRAPPKYTEKVSLLLLFFYQYFPCDIYNNIHVGIMSYYYILHANTSTVRTMREYTRTIATRPLARFQSPPRRSRLLFIIIL
jgi:hypothetical protein